MASGFPSEMIWKGQDYHSIAALAKACGVEKSTLRRRLKQGLSIDEACQLSRRRGTDKKITWMDKEYPSMADLARANAIDPAKLRSRLHRGLSVEEAVALGSISRRATPVEVKARRAREKVTGLRPCYTCKEPKPVEAFYAGENQRRCKICVRVRKDLRNYGETRQELAEQRGAYCHNPGCRAKLPLNELNIDHDHKTGETRGLLCVACNHALGKVQDNPDKLRGLLLYLEWAPVLRKERREAPREARRVARRVAFVAEARRALPS